MFPLTSEKNGPAATGLPMNVVRLDAGAGDDVLEVYGRLTTDLHI